MNNTYVIERLPSCASLPDWRPGAEMKLPKVWRNCEPANIDCYRWDVNGYRPHAEARVMYDERGLHVVLTAQEAEIRAQAEMRGAICTDSCLEFFFQPDVNCARYVNVEMNPLGIHMIGIGEGRFNRFEAAQLPLPNMQINYTALPPDDYAAEAWGIAYTVPAGFLKLWFGVELKPGLQMRGNFYKCGDKSRYEHYGMWNEVEVDKPDFHRPEYFGKLALAD